MPNKIRLNNDLEFTLVNYGYSRDDSRKTIQFRFGSELGIGEIQSTFKDADAISPIFYLDGEGNLITTITDCAEYQSMTQDSEGKYIVILSTDKIAAELKLTKEDLAIAKQELDTVKGDLQTSQAELLTANIVLNIILTEVIPQVLDLIIPE